MVSRSLLGRRSSGRLHMPERSGPRNSPPWRLTGMLLKVMYRLRKLTALNQISWVSFESERSRWRQKLRNDAQARLNGPISSEVQSSGQMRLHVLKGTANAAVIRLPSEMVQVSRSSKFITYEG